MRGWDAIGYKARNRDELLLERVQQFRRIATRCERSKVRTSVCST